MSSLSGLKAAPSIKIFLPATSPSSWFARSNTRCLRRRFTASTSAKKSIAEPTPSSSALAIKARMSFGKQPPPKPMPLRKNCEPILASMPIASASETASAPAASEISAMALIKLILVARKLLAATFTNSLVATSITKNGVCPAAEPVSPFKIGP